MCFCVFVFVCASVCACIHLCDLSPVLADTFHFILRYLYRYAGWLLKSTKRTVMLTNSQMGWLEVKGSGIESLQYTKSGDTMFG